MVYFAKSPKPLRIIGDYCFRAVFWLPPRGTRQWILTKPTLNPHRYWIWHLKLDFSTRGKSTDVIFPPVVVSSISPMPTYGSNKLVKTQFLESADSIYRRQQFRLPTLSITDNPGCLGDAFDVEDWSGDQHLEIIFTPCNSLTAFNSY